MNIKENTKVKTFKKYDLSKESLAAAASGMHKVTDLDQRCITFTIHLADPARHGELCRILFDRTEDFFTKLGKKRLCASHSGLASFIDVNGSKLSGADRDPSQTHCHGCIFMPHGISEQHVRKLIHVLKERLKPRKDIVKRNKKAIKFSLFEQNSQDASLLKCLFYAQKEEVHVDSDRPIGIFLPFDIRSEFGEDISRKILKKRDFTLDLLRSSESFKIFREPKCREFFGGTKVISFPNRPGDEKEVRLRKPHSIPGENEPKLPARHEELQ